MNHSAIIFLLLSYALGAQSDSLTKTRIIEIANSEGYYMHTDNWNEPVLKYDTLEQNWVVISSRYYHKKTGIFHVDGDIREKGNCKNTNGCSVYEWRTIRIHPYTGAVIRKIKGRKLFPNYES